MRSSGVELDFHERRGAKLDDFVPLGERFAKLASGNMLAGFCRRGEGFHSSAMDWIAADGKIDLSGKLIEGAFNQRKVSFFDGAGAERLGQFCVRKVVLGDDDETGGFFVEAVDNAGTKAIFEFGAALRERLSAAEERVDQRAMRIPCPGMDAHAGGFVDDEQVIVFVEDIERNGFGFRAKRRALACLDKDPLITSQFVRRLGGRAIHQNQTVLKKLLDSGAGEFREMRDNPLIEASAAVGLCDKQLFSVGFRTHFAKRA